MTMLTQLVTGDGNMAGHPERPEQQKSGTCSEKPGVGLHNVGCCNIMLPEPDNGGSVWGCTQIQAYTNGRERASVAGP